MPTKHEILSALRVGDYYRDMLGNRIKRNGLKNLSALCPFHDDQKPKLVHRYGDGRLLLSRGRRERVRLRLRGQAQWRRESGENARSSTVNKPNLPGSKCLRHWARIVPT